jgi:hypothetical protein
MNLQGVCLHTASCVYVQGVSFSTFVQFFYAGEATVWHLIKKMSMPEPARCRNKETQSGTGMLRYQAQLLGVPMPTYGFQDFRQVGIAKSIKVLLRHF